MESGAYLALTAHLLQTGHAAGLTGHTWLRVDKVASPYVYKRSAFPQIVVKQQQQKKPAEICHQQELSGSSRWQAGCPRRKSETMEELFLNIVTKGKEAGVWRTARFAERHGSWQRLRNGDESWLPVSRKSIQLFNTRGGVARPTSGDTPRYARSRRGGGQPACKDRPLPGQSMPPKKISLWNISKTF